MTSAPVLVSAALVSLVGIGCGMEAPPQSVTLEGRALASVELSGLALLPAVVVEAAPPPPAGAVGIPAFDRAHVSHLKRDRSYSIGTASRGYLVNGRAVPSGDPAISVRARTLRKRAQFGTDELVEALARAATHVAQRWPGSHLYVGDLSYASGGDIPGHASHASGRDVDLVFYMRDEAGRMADSPQMLPIGGNGKARWGEPRLVFDLPRNWALVEALLRDPHVQVQYILIADHLKALLLGQAEQVAADETVIRRAHRVLRQPRDSSIHEEHFHVRVYCALAERVEGCVDYGRVHPWIDTYESALARRINEVMPFLQAGGAEEVRYAITRLVRLRAKGALVHLEPLVGSPQPRIAQLAADAVAFLRGRRTPPRWAHLQEEDPGD